MNKREALAVLIKHSSLFSEQLKQGLIAGIDALPEPDVQALGELLATEKKNEIQLHNGSMSEADALLALQK